MGLLGVPGCVYFNVQLFPDFHRRRRPGSSLFRHQLPQCHVDRFFVRHLPGLFMDVCLKHIHLCRFCQCHLCAVLASFWGQKLFQSTSNLFGWCGVFLFHQLAHRDWFLVLRRRGKIHFTHHNDSSSVQFNSRFLTCDVSHVAGPNIGTMHVQFFKRSKRGTGTFVRLLFFSGDQFNVQHCFGAWDPCFGHARPRFSWIAHCDSGHQLHCRIVVVWVPSVWQRQPCTCAIQSFFPKDFVLLFGRQTQPAKAAKSPPAHPPHCVSLLRCQVVCFVHQTSNTIGAWWSIRRVANSRYVMPVTANYQANHCLFCY